LVVVVVYMKFLFGSISSRIKVIAEFAEEKKNFVLKLMYRTKKSKEKKSFQLSQLSNIFLMLYLISSCSIFLKAHDFSSQ